MATAEKTGESRELTDMMSKPSDGQRFWLCASRPS